MRLTESERDLLRKLGSIGGKKSANSKTPGQRKALARKANKARLTKRAAAAKETPGAAA